MTFQEQRIITRSSESDFEKTVNELLEQGWAVIDKTLKMRDGYFCVVLSAPFRSEITEPPNV